VRWILVLLLIIVVVVVMSTHCETLTADGTYDRRGCK